MTKKKKNISKDDAIKSLWELGELSWKLKGKQKEIYSHFKNSEDDISACLISRQFGKCLAEGTEIPTTKGFKKIQDIKVGDFVYGYNKFGKIEPTEVKQVHYQGIKDVYDIVHSNKVYATATDDHQFLVYNTNTKIEQVKRLKDLNKNDQLRRENIENTEVSEPSIPFSKVNKRKMKCWDIGINNETHLFVMQNGLITHNSFTLCIIAIELCLKQEGAIVKYACPQQKMVERVINPRIKDIIIDCPDNIKPEWKSKERIWLFPNGSEIQVAGTDNGNYDNLRGGSSSLCIADEAGFMDELETVIYSVMLPTTDTTGGKVFLASTPNDKNPNHDFHEFFVKPLDSANKLLKFTYLDSPLLDDLKKEKIIGRYPGGIDNIKFKCEYLCEIPNISESNIIPEFNAVKSNIIKEVESPNSCDFYTSADVGFHDLTLVLFSYYDYDKSKLIIKDEFVINGPELTTDKLNKEILFKEELNYIDSNKVVHKPYIRVMDNDLKLINDLSRFYGTSFIATEKHNKEQYVDTVRRWIDAERIIISPKCKNLIYHLEYGQWHYTRQGTFSGKFKHIKGNNEAGLLKSHADGIDALIYLVRNIQTSRSMNSNLTLNNSNYYFNEKNKTKNSSKSKEFMKKILNIK